MFKYILKIASRKNTLLTKRLERCMHSAEFVHKITGENTDKLFLEVLWNWARYGCSDEDFLTFEFYRKNSREKKRWLTSKKNNRYLYKTVYDDRARAIFDQKDLFDKEFAALMKHEVLICKEHNEEEIIAFIQMHGEVIAKPAGGACGIGISKIGSSNKKEIKRLLSDIKKGDDIIIEQLVHQHPELARIYPHSVNTIRVITMLDQKGEVHIITTVIKFGAGDNCVSNTMGGGYCCHIDPESGIIDSMGKDIHGDSHFKHAYTGVPFPGFQIPNWEGVLPYAKKLAKVVPSGRYIGWDIVILEDGYDVFEGNLHPGQDFQGCDGIGRWNEIKSLI